MFLVRCSYRNNRKWHIRAKQRIKYNFLTIVSVAKIVIAETNVDGLPDNDIHIVVYKW